MIKRFFFSFVVIFVIVLCAGVFVYNYFKQREAVRQNIHNQRAPQQKFTILEGWGILDITKKLASDAFITKPDQFFQAEIKFTSSAYPFLASKPDNANLEGFLFPDTYFLSGSSTPESLSEMLIKKALDNFGNKFTPTMEQAARSKNISVFQIIILASIIEKETGRDVITTEQKQSLDTERKIIAGIFYNRLGIGMALQSDATINYVTKKNTPGVSIKDTEISSPYNTYVHPGLPPGPISNPSLSAIMSALYPTETNYLYFLHKQPSGEPVYSTSFEQHVINKHKYLNQ